MIGAGPSGLIAAREAARRGVDVLVLEEHAQIGLPVECAGLLSLRGLKAIGAYGARERFVLNELRAATFYSPSGRELRIEAPKPVACVVDRHELDVVLAEQAMDAGAEVELGRLVKRISIRPGGVELGGSWGSVSAELAIVAEGFRSRLVRQLGLRGLDWRRVLPASQIDVPAPDVDEEGVEVHLGRGVAPGFFAWVIPLGDGVARVGLACRGADPRDMLRAFLKRRFGLRGIETAYSGSVLKCGPIPKTYAERALVVGDAAGQAKPTTGGGVILGGLCASIAGQVAAEAVEAGDFSEPFLSSYERRWRRLLGAEFSAMKKARALLDIMPDGALDVAFELAKRAGLAERVPEIADMDFQSSLLRRLPRLITPGPGRRRF
mgnify:CR=1 FL=1